MLIGLAGGALWALDTVILGMALALPVFTGDPRAAILAPFASTFLHDLCSSLWMLGYTGLRRQYKAVWQALRTRGGRFVALGALLGGPAGMTGYVLAINAIGPAYTAIISALYPALGTVLAHFFLKEKLRPTGLIGLALSIGGVIALGYTPGAALPKGHLLGFGCAVLYRLGSRGGHLHLRTAKQHRHQRPGAANPPAGVGADLCHCFAAGLQGLGLYRRAVWHAGTVDHRPVRPVRHRLLSVLLQGAGQAGHRQGHAPEHYLRCLVAAVFLPAFAPGPRHQGHTLRPGGPTGCAAGRLRKTTKIGKIKQPMSAKNGHTKTEGGFQYARFISFNAGDEPIL